MYLALVGLSYQTGCIRVWYVSVEHELFYCPISSYALCGNGKRQITCLLIIPDLLHQLWSQLPCILDCIRVFGIFALGRIYLFFIYGGLYVTPHDEAVDLPSHMAVHLNHSKNDPFGVATSVCLGATVQRLCPVVALLGYLLLGGYATVAGPSFIFCDCIITPYKPRLIVPCTRCIDPGSRSGFISIQWQYVAST